MRVEEQIIKEAIDKEIKSSEEFRKLQRRVLRKFGLSYPKGSALLGTYRELASKGIIQESKTLEKILKLNKVRTLSGVAVVAVVTEPYPCGGDCIFCPTENGMPKSYLSNEPAIMRAIQNQFDPVEQTLSRIKTLEETGHATDKLEIIILGGSFSTLPTNYRKKFIQGIYDALNEKVSEGLSQAIKLNEAAKRRCVGLTIETRPDLITEEEIRKLRKLSITRVELGVQTLDNQILLGVKRGHTREITVRATRLLKDAGFKVGYHIMPNLPGSNLEKDRAIFEELFTNPDFRPDQLKIYPCVVTKDAEIYQWWLNGHYQSYSEKELVNLLILVKEKVPPYVRISRLFRDIPANRIEAGVKKTNLREIVQQEMQKQGKKCRCIRCREVRDLEIVDQDTPLVLKRLDYQASDGQEIFLTFESLKGDRLFAFLRLRLPSSIFTSQPSLIPELDGAAIIREVHTYGEVAPIAKKGRVQHQGLGKRLVKAAEKIVTKEFGLKKIAVISAVGVRNYYRRLGYHLAETYMLKEI
jgi:elongator complex protein 3